MTATYGSAKVSKKITVNILNPNNEINLENKTIKPYAGVNNEYVPFSTFIVEKPENKEYQETTSFTGYDYMIKFKIPYIDKNTYPTTISKILQNLCSLAGVQCGTTTFVNSDYIVTGNPFTNNEDCITVLSNIAQLAGGFAHIGRDDKLYIVNIAELINELTVKEVHEMSITNLNKTFGTKKVLEDLNKTTINPYNRRKPAFTLDAICVGCSSVGFDDTNQMIVVTSYNNKKELVARTVIKPPSFVEYSKFDNKK